MVSPTSAKPATYNSVPNFCTLLSLKFLNFCTCAMFTSVTSVLSTVKSQTDRLKESLNTPSVQLRKAQLIDLSSKVKSNVVEKSSWIQNSLAQKLQPHLLNDHDARQQKVNSGTSTSSARTSTPKNTKPTRLSAPPIQRRTAI